MDTFTIDDENKAHIKALVQRAAAEPIPYAVIQAIAVGTLKSEGFSEKNTIWLPPDFLVVYVHEEQELGVLRHLSVSSKSPGLLPHPDVVKILLQEFGFLRPLGELYWWEGQVSVSQTQMRAINVLEPLDGDWAPYLKPNDRTSN